MLGYHLVDFRYKKRVFFVYLTVNKTFSEYLLLFIFMIEVNNVSVKNALCKLKENKQLTIAITINIINT